jgi:hypothetical protein
MDTDKRAELIMGAAVGYAPEQIRLFVTSLARVHFRGRLILFVYRKQLDGIQALLQKPAATLDARLVPVRGIREHAKWIRSSYKRLLAMLPAELSAGLKRRMLRFQGAPHVARYFHYANYLATHDRYTHVLLSDVRDVIFQDDPFSGVGHGLYLGMENPALTIATEPFDRDWMLDAYGEAMLQRLGDRQISCSGVTLGDAVSIKHYVNQILREALLLPFRKMKTRIYDQAFHNKLLHCGELPTARLCQPMRSLIATVGCLDAAQLILTSDGLLLNEDGRVAPIVHQYDRHPPLRRAFEARLNASQFSGADNGLACRRCPPLPTAREGAG